ncbi:unnamed protein product [Malus baccata var. baccata]
MLLCTKKKGMPKKYGPDGTAPSAKRSYSPRVPTSSRAPSEHNQNKTPASEPIGLKDKAMADRLSQKRTGTLGKGMCRKTNNCLIQSNSADVNDKARKMGHHWILHELTHLVHRKSNVRPCESLHRELHRRTASKAEKPDQEPNVEESRAEPNVKTPEPEPNVETPRPEPNVETLGLEPNIGTPRPEPNVGPNVEMPRPEPNAGVVTSVLEWYEVKNDSKEEEPKVEDYYCDYSSDYEEGKSQSSSSS